MPGTKHFWNASTTVIRCPSAHDLHRHQVDSQVMITFNSVIYGVYPLRGLRYTVITVANSFV